MEVGGAACGLSRVKVLRFWRLEKLSHGGLVAWEIESLDAVEAVTGIRMLVLEFIGIVASTGESGMRGLNPIR